MGNTFETQGYLADDDQGFYDYLYSRFGDYIDLAKELNQLGQELQYRLEVHNEYNPEILGATLYSRFLSAYQAAILISFKGMKNQLYSQLRCMLEPLFPLVALSKDRGFGNELVLSENVEHKKNISKYIRYCERNGLVDDNLEKARSLHRAVETTIKEEKLKKISIYECAVKADLEDMYDTLYSHTSSYLHSSVKSLEESLILDLGQTKIIALKSEPDCEGFDGIYTTAMHCTLHAIQAVSDIFELELTSVIEDISERLRGLEEKGA